MLSYDAATCRPTSSDAQALVTDGYRPQLVAQQQAVVQGSPVVDNEYWVTNSAVLTSTRDRATMLVLMQGQRGVAKNMRTHHRDRQVDFEKFGDGKWQVGEPDGAGQAEAGRWPEMSPRRRIDGVRPAFGELAPQPRRVSGLSSGAGRRGAALIVVAVAVSTLVLVTHERTAAQPSRTWRRSNSCAPS